MKSILKYILAVIMIVPFISCEDDLMNQEHYKKVIYIKSGDNNIFSYSHAMNDSVTTGYLTLGSGGSMPLDEDVVVTLEMDTATLNLYNYRNFGKDYGKYFKLLDSNRYVLPTFEIVLKKGEPAATTYFPIEVDANKLSPDSSYCVPLRIKSASGYEVNEEKNFVLYKIELSNKYSSNGLRSYKMKGTRTLQGSVASNITTTKSVVPLASNRIRIFPENIVSSTKLSDIENKTIVLVVNDDNTVRVGSFKYIQVEQMDGCHYNPKLKMFKIFYRYRLPGEKKWTTVVESLTRIE